MEGSDRAALAPAATLWEVLGLRVGSGAFKVIPGV